MNNKKKIINKYNRTLSKAGISNKQNKFGFWFDGIIVSGTVCVALRSISMLYDIQTLFCTKKNLVVAKV